MKLGYIGLGKMGANMVERLVEKGHEVITYDPNAQPVVGAVAAEDIEALVSNLSTPRTIWIMVPHQAVDNVLNDLSVLLSAGDTIIDGGNSNYKESIRRSSDLSVKGIRFLDAGVSGGPSGARNGACIMVGGERGVYEEYKQLFKDLTVENGYNHFGAVGAGHFVKMVHNGIEYGMMQSIAEGFAVMKNSGFDLNLKDVANVYNHGSVITSSLVGWLAKAYKEHGQDLKDISGEVEASGEGQWTVEVAQELGVPVKVIEESLEFRTESKGNPSYIGRIVSALRNQFGGHNVEKS